MVASPAEGCKVARSNPGCRGAAPIYTIGTRRLGGTSHEGGGCDQSIASTVSNAIVRSWLWSTATRSSPLGYFSNYRKYLIIDPTFCGSRFSPGRLLAIEDFIFTAPTNPHKIANIIGPCMRSVIHPSLHATPSSRDIRHYMKYMSAGIKEVSAQAVLQRQLMSEGADYICRIRHNLGNHKYVLCWKECVK